MNKEVLVKEVNINAPAARVWEAITSKDEMKQWTGFDIAALEPVVGFEFSFYGYNEGRAFLHLCKITEVVPNKKFAYSWRYESMPDVDTLVTIELFDEGGRTRVRLTHEGLDKFPQDGDYKRSNFDMGWTEITKLLKELIEKK